MTADSIPATRVSAVAQWVFTALPVLSLAVMILAWIRYGLDLPCLDDWREYLSGKISSLELSHLFRSDNDTISVTTRVLDALVQRYLDGNSIAYQLLTMLLVLGSLLWLQWALLNKVLRNRLLSSCAFVSTLFMLQPDSYWGRQNIAYIQAVPLAFVLGMLYVALFAQWRPLWRNTAVFLAAIISGLTYISGAFASLATAGVLLFACILRKDLRARLLQPSLFMLVSSAATVALQLWVIVVVQHGKTHRRDAPWATPLDADFWFYLIGKISRSLMLPADWFVISSAIAVILVACTVVAGLLLFFSKPKPERAADTSRTNGALVILSLIAVVAIYLCLVAAGRTNLRPDSVDTGAEIFRFGYGRFHFFWVTLLWPWTIAAAMLVVQHTRRQGGIQKLQRAGWIALSLCIVFVALFQGAGRHTAYFRGISEARTRLDLACLQQSLMHGKGINCPTLAPHGDLTRAYRFAMFSGASFIRYAPPSLMSSNTSMGRAIDLLGRAPGVFNVSNARVEQWESGSLRLSGGRDVQVMLSAARPQQLDGCAALRISADISTGFSDTAQLFYQIPGDSGFTENRSMTVALKSGHNDSVAFIVTSMTGFKGRLRLDPVKNFQPSTVSEISVRCLF